MAGTLYSVTISLDGYITGPGGMQVGLERIKIMEAPLATGMWYRVVR